MQRPKIILIGTIVAALALFVIAWKFLAPGTPIVQGEVLPAGIPVEGPASSTVTVVEFLDFQCPSCAGFHPAMKKIRDEYAGRIRYAQRMFPIAELHEFAKGAAIAAVCSSKQNKYFEYADALIVNQDHLERADLVRYADALHLDVTAFNACLDDPAIADFVVAERKAGDALGVQGTPWLFINRESIEGTPTYEQLKQLIDERLK